MSAFILTQIWHVGLQMVRGVLLVVGGLVQGAGVGRKVQGSGGGRRVRVQEDDDGQVMEHAHDMPQEMGDLAGPISPNTKLHQHFGAIVKNTFLEVQDDDEVAPKLRLVHTAAGRLDSMGGLPSNPSFETLM
ncbi:hypothetical protein AK812_SmicGene43775 [Symbiodinium microadriaticum]|uniref:Uncharacterized protein n=1 Tax=Symbiodinium microadriaticum TaxID=2951 RepID=A0A1Q9C058_SYMMI|nr:hypothetical protein AK812_SmicGene43775 [Symbiodinium microadriaticum]